DQRHHGDDDKLSPCNVEHCALSPNPRRNDDQHHHADNDKLSLCNVEHCISTPKAAAAVGRPYQRELRAAGSVARMEQRDIRDDPTPDFASAQSGLRAPNQPDEASARGLAPAADASAVW